MKEISLTHKFLAFGKLFLGTTNEGSLLKIKVGCFAVMPLKTI